jgi:imidazolonepropionase-like amidohydrolase
MLFTRSRRARARLPGLVAACAMLAALPAGAQAPAWLLQADKLYVAPDQPPLLDAAVLVRGRSIVSVGPRAQLQVPPGTAISRCSGPVVTAGFYNSHVHLLGPAWADAARQPPARLAQGLQNLLTRHGFTTAVDLGSDHANTAALQRRLERGEVTGPRLLTLGLPLFPPQGLPGYLDPYGPAFLARLPQPETPVAAVGVVQANLDAGAVGTKLFLVTPRQGRLQRMPADVARVAAVATQRRGGVVVAHPTDLAGVQAALDAGVDLLAHTTHGTLARWPAALVQQAVARGVAMTPTLQLMGYELAKEQARGPIVQQLIDASVAQVRDFAAAGGEILFGTDAGYMTALDPTEEYLLLARAGLSPMQILAALTTRPAAKWQDPQRGRLAPGLAADLVVLDADPADDAAHFSRVRCTIGAGRVLFERAPAPRVDRP